MGSGKIVYFKSVVEFRNWLKKNHTETELFVGFYKIGSGIKGITYKEAVDQALCFGWIDGIKKKVDEVSYMHRFSPRKKRSIWSTINLKRAEELINLGLMHQVGLNIFNDRDIEKIKQYSFERNVKDLDEPLKKIFMNNIQAWDFFQLQPPSYRKVASLWVVSAKREETRLKRLCILIEDSENKRRLKIVTLQKD